MNIKGTRTEDSLTVELEGRLDTLSSPELAEYLEKQYASVSELIIDMKKLDYISSAGLRVILKAEKAMKDRGGILIRNANKLVMGVFRVTGFENLLRFQ